MKILILMAGRGSRFLAISPEIPKPLVELHGIPLIRWVVENLRFNPEDEFIFVALKEHVEKYSLSKILSQWNIKFKIVEVSTVTQGAACSALLAKEHLAGDELIIANSDQFILYDKKKFLDESRKNDGSIMTMTASGNKWSYVREDQDRVVEVKEKVQISNKATVGIYYFKRGEDFISAAEDMIAADDRYNNEFYLAPTYNYLLKKGMCVKSFHVGDAGSEMIGLGTAEDFMSFANDPRSLSLAETIRKK